MQLWKGRFSKEIDPKTNDFNSSIKFDSRMYKEDIDGSLAHAAMLCAQGIISAEDLVLCTSISKYSPSLVIPTPSGAANDII